MINTDTFFSKIKANGLFKSLTQKQVDSIESILHECEVQRVTDLRQIAYILATAYHECYNPKTPETRLTPIVEFGGEKYLKSKPYYPFYGRGFSQLTWEANYLKEKRRLGIDVFAKPDLMLNIPTAANSHVYCMMNGVYTGKKLTDYIQAEKCDFINARRVVNGTDKAELIMSYAAKFLEALK
jgi:hypothetical protein